MKTKTILLSLFLLVSARLFSQDWQWATQADGTSACVGKSTAIDAVGNVYVTGYFSDSIIFDQSHILVAVGHADIFIVKYNQNGGVMWARQAGGVGDDRAFGITISGLNRVCVTGDFVGTAFFGTSMITSAGAHDVFVAEYNANGQLILVIKGGGLGDDTSNDIATYGAGDVYITGSFSGAAAFGSATVTSAGGNDIFIAKYNSSGIFQWAKSAGGPHDDIGTSIGIDGMGESYITGYFNGGNFFSGNATFGNVTTLASYGQKDMFLAKYDLSGNFMWAIRAGGINYDAGNGLSVNFYGECYITGYFSANAHFGNDSLMTSGWQNIFVAKYDPLGNAIWATQSGGMNAHDAGSAIYIDPAGNSFIAGYFSDTVSFGQSTFASAGGTDVFVSKYDPAGNCLWGKSCGGTTDDFASSIAGDTAGNSYIIGDFNNTLMFFDTITLSNPVAADVYLAKLSNAPTGISDVLALRELVHAYPNPFTESAVITFLDNHVHYLTLYDLSGREVQYAEGANEVIIFRNDLPPGLYLYRVISQEGELVALGKIIIE